MVGAGRPQCCLLERDRNVLIVTLNRPESANTLDAVANAELARIFDDFVADPALDAAIVTGAGEHAFCSGADLTHQGAALPPSGFAGLTLRFDNTKPVLAAVNGDARGEGFELALACDLIIAAEEATFGLDQPLSGRVALACSIDQLLGQIPLKRAMAALLTGEPISAPEGVALGFVNDLCHRNEVVAVARSWSERILRCEGRALRATKQTVQRLRGPSPRAATVASH